MGATRASFLAHVDPSGECWEWRGWRDARGYGKATDVDGTRRKDWAHRVAYRLWRGPIGGGLTVDHLCRNVGCVNPQHLELVTLAENIRRAHPERDTCTRGHSLADAYTEVTRHGRVAKRCRVCHTDGQKRRRRERLGSSD